MSISVTQLICKEMRRHCWSCLCELEMPEDDELKDDELFKIPVCSKCYGLTE